jgi:hypothetical protein
MVVIVPLLLEAPAGPEADDPPGLSLVEDTSVAAAGSAASIAIMAAANVRRIEGTGSKWS